MMLSNKATIRTWLVQDHHKMKMRVKNPIKYKWKIKLKRLTYLRVMRKNRVRKASKKDEKNNKL